ncbi:MAG: MFS transporter [Acidimicrobiales bacterium]|nr:MFS transporter [Acidimicrobiales bacterium]
MSSLGTQITAVAAPIQVYDLTGSSLAVGFLGVVQVVPLVLGSLYGGVLADAYDRRKVLLVAQALLAATSAGLVVNAALERPSVVAVYLLGACQAAFSGIDNPTRAASAPVLVERELVPSALALTQLLWQVSLVVGPALAGVVIAATDLSVAYALDVVSFAAAAACMVAMRPIRPERAPGDAPAAGVGRSILEGLRFLGRRPVLQAVELIDLNAMVFGMPKALFPELAATTFGGGPATAGMLYAAPGVGALLGAVTSGWLPGVERQGWAVVWAVVGWGAAIAAFGFTEVLGVALFLLALAGLADVISAVLRNSILQLTVPDHLRGRVSSVHIAVVTGGPRLGDLESGAVAALTSPAFAVVSGGLVCMMGAGVIARLYPTFVQWRLVDHLRRPPPASG